MADLDILFLGMLFPRDIEQEIKSKMKSGMQDAANALQWNLIDGLDANHCGTIRIVTYLPVDSYPRGYTQARIPTHVFQHSEDYRSEDRVVGCTNLTVEKQFANQGPFRRVLKSWARDGSGRRKVLLLYSAEPLFLSMAKYIKTIAPEVQTCCVIADLPEFSCARTLHGLLKLYNDYQARRAETMYRYMDRFVLLTRQMADRLRISVPYMVMGHCPGGGSPGAAHSPEAGAPALYSLYRDAELCLWHRHPAGGLLPDSRPGPSAGDMRLWRGAEGHPGLCRQPHCLPGQGGQEPGSGPSAPGGGAGKPPAE